MRHALALAAFVVWTGAACAQHPAPLPGPDGALEMAPYLEYFEDPSGALTLEDVFKPAIRDRFRGGGARTLNFGYTRSAYWLHFRLPGGAPPGERLLLEIRFPSIDRIEFYQPLSASGRGQGYEMRLGGDTFPWAAREVAHRNHVFRVAAPTASGPHDYYLRAGSESVLTMPVYLWPATAFAEYDREAQLAIGLFYGLVLALVLYNSMVFFSVRDRVYLYYVIYAAAFGVYLLAFDGLAFQYLWPESIWWANHGLPTALALALAVGALFATTFLDIRRNAPRAWRPMQAIAAAGGLLAFSAAAGWPLSPGLVLRALSVLGFTAAAFAIYAAVRAVVAGFRPAQFFLLAWGALLVFIVLATLRNFALVPTTFVTVHGLHVGFGLDILLLSFALADRINALKREAASAQARALASQQALLDATRASERELEGRIAERTMELNRVNDRLRDEARERDQLMAKLREQEEHLRHMAQHDALTGLPNRLSMLERLALQLELAKRNRKKLAVMLIDLDNFKLINDSRGHLAGDRVLEAIAGRLRASVRGSDTVARYGGDEFVVLAGELDSPGDAGSIAEKIADMVSLPLSIDGATENVGCAIGISLFPDDAEDAEGLLECADAAMYAVKARKNAQAPRYSFFSRA